MKCNRKNGQMHTVLFDSSSNTNLCFWVIGYVVNSCYVCYFYISLWTELSRYSTSEHNAICERICEEWMS
jgi:abortive infection bacteriophage resistance protein